MLRFVLTTIAASVLLATLASGSLAADAPALATQAKPARHALVIGNSQYLNTPLINPKNDAQAIADRLRQAGFSVTLKLDAGRRELQEAIGNYGLALSRDKGVGVFYYAGHGVQLNWRNFLLPVDAKIRSKSDIQSEAVDLGLLLDSLTRARNSLNLIILDACRNNPFGPDYRTDDRGLSQLDAPPGTFLAYATAPGNTAEDGVGSHGLYTDHLLQEMLVPGAAVEDVFKRVRLAVRKTSQGEQIPWESTSLEADFAFIPGQSTRDAAKEFDVDLASWQQLRLSGSPEQLEAFIAQRPNGKFAELAQFRLDQLLAAKGEKSVKARSTAGEVCTPEKSGLPAPYSGVAQAYKVGERYAYRRLDLLSRQEKGRSDATISRIEGDEVHFSDGQVRDPFGNDVRAPDGRQWTPYQFFIADYQLGKRWPAQFIVTLADGRKVSNEFQLRVANRERITLPAGTFDAFRIEARGANLSNGDVLERTAWVAPERMRGLLALETTVKRDGKLIEGERSELVEHAAERPAAPQTSQSSSLLSY
jgi:uncharacterized caspase-like protein